MQGPVKHDKKLNGGALSIMARLHRIEGNMDGSAYVQKYVDSSISAKYAKSMP